MFPGKPCVYFEGTDRDFDHHSLEDPQAFAAAKALRDDAGFANYRYVGSNKSTKRCKTQEAVVDLLLDFMAKNFLDTRSAFNWGRSFNILNVFGLLPAPVPTDAQMQAAENARPADDGNPVALRDDGTTPVTYVVRGKIVRYSNEMLQALTAKGYETVMQFNRVDTGNPYVRKEMERAAGASQHEQVSHGTATDGNAVAVIDGKPVIGPDGKKYSTKMLEAMSGDEYRILMRLNKGPKVFAPDAHPLD
jgi:hypothetical protein